MQSVYTVLILAVSIIQVHSQSPEGNISPTTSNDPGFNFNYFFLWHSDATILNYLRQNGGNGGNQVVAMRVGDSSNSQGQDTPLNIDPRVEDNTIQDSTGNGTGGHGHGHGAEDNESDFRNLGRLLEVLGV
ncbi:unnamed protein product [Meganyctiphanes norvegica]|uniref:Uncharacterized protein n=1 Tax=Meganyctiphanes norvegica TaxID=48144 RepID=A0AAV2SGW4_MEGNR